MRATRQALGDLLGSESCDRTTTVTGLDGYFAGHHHRGGLRRIADRRCDECPITVTLTLARQRAAIVMVRRRRRFDRGAIGGGEPSRLQQLGIFLAMAVLLASCMGGVSPEGMDQDQPRPDGPGYNLTVVIAGRPEHTFKGTITTWDPLTGIVTLGPEERGEPLGLFILTLGQGETIYSRVYITEATFSTTKVRVGTAADLQAELYGALEPQCGETESKPIAVTPEWVSGEICVVVAGLEPDGVPSAARIFGEIAAFAR